MDHGILHSRLKELEQRLRKWRALRFGIDPSVLISPQRRSNSQDPRLRPATAASTDSRCSASPSSSTSSPSHVDNFRLQNIPIGCRSTPTERRLATMDRTRLNLAIDGRTRQNALAEIENMYQHVLSRSGLLTLGGEDYKVSVQELVLDYEIGHGSCGHVSRCTYKTFPMAVKVMARTADKEENKRNIMDLATVTTVNCPNIVRCFGYFISDTEVRVAMEQCAICLDRLLKTLGEPFPENVLSKITVGILNALNYLKEEKQIIHRDVKPSNMLLDWNGTVKLCDFGISGRLIESMAHSIHAGCPPYMAPERLDSQSNSNYDVRSDVWSLGVSLVELSTGRYPYSCKNEFEILAAILQSEPPFLPQNAGFSVEFVGFVNACLIKNVNQRPKYRQLVNFPLIQNNTPRTRVVSDWFDSLVETEKIRLPGPPGLHR